VFDRILHCIAKQPSIGVVGICSWDSILAVEVMPEPGGFALVTDALELPGGTSANAAVTAARLGARAQLYSAVGDDPAGQALVGALAREGVDVSQVAVSPGGPTDRTTVITSLDPPDRTIFWRQGAILRKGDRIDIDRLFTRDLVLLDSVDPGLRRFLIDLPVHTYPGIRILVPMTYVVDFPGPDELDSIVRCDALVGSETELLALTQESALENAIAALQAHMRISNLRHAGVTRGAKGAIAFDQDRIHEIPALEVDALDSTGAGDAFAGGFAIGLAGRLDLLDTLVLANCVAGLSTRAVGAQTALPNPDELEAALSSYLPRVRL
jgi:ribokinase